MKEKSVRDHLRERPPPDEQKKNSSNEYSNTSIRTALKLNMRLVLEVYLVSSI